MFTAVCIAVLCSGCATECSQAACGGQPLPQGHAPVRLVTQANANFSVASEVNTKLRVVFRLSSAEKTFSLRLAERLAGSIVLDKADILINSPGDIVISITPEFELVDKTRDYHRVKCNRIAVSIASKQKVYAMKTIEPKALPRKLGIQNAKNQYLEPAAKALVPYLRKQLEKISNEYVAVSVVDFALANVQERPEPQYVAAQVNKVAQILSSTSGIINYTNIRQDVSTARCSFRIVYLKDQFPQGITNVLNLKLAGK